jgi:hypothetical protein
MKSCGRKLFMQINQIVNSFILFTATVKPAVTCIKRSPCPVIENFKWIEPLLRGHLSYKTTSSLSWRWPLNTGLTEVESDVEWSIWHMILIRLRLSGLNIALWPLFALWIFTCWLTCLITCEFTCSLTCLINCEFTCSLTCLIICEFTRSLTCLITCEFTHSLTCLITCEFTHSLTCLITCELTCLINCEFTCSLTCLITCSLTCFINCEFTCQFTC